MLHGRQRNIRPLRCFCNLTSYVETNKLPIGLNHGSACCGTVVFLLTQPERRGSKMVKRMAD